MFLQQKNKCFCPKKGPHFQACLLTDFIKILLKDEGNRLFLRVLPVLLEQGLLGVSLKQVPFFQNILNIRIPGTLFCEVGPVRDTALGRFSVYFCLMMWWSRSLLFIRKKILLLHPKKKRNDIHFQVFCVFVVWLKFNERCLLKWRKGMLNCLHFITLVRNLS